jgi:DNA-binding cell septation regulator SpoVG
MTKSRKVRLTEITFFPIIPSPKGVCAFVSFLYNNELRISDVAIITKPEGSYRFSFPIKTLQNGKTIQCVYPISEPIEKAISQQLLKAYTKFLKTKVRND